MALGVYLGGGVNKAMYHMEGNSSDSSGNSNNGTDTNISYGQVGGMYGQAATFNGSSSYIATGSTGFASGANPFTISWKIQTSINNVRQAIDNYGSGAGGQGMFFYVQENSNSGSTQGALQAEFYGSNGEAKGKTIVSTGKPVTATLTYDGSRIRLYVNGSLDVTGNSYTANIVLNTRQVGKVFTASAWFFNGKMDEGIYETGAWSDSKVRKYHTYSKGRLVL